MKSRSDAWKKSEIFPWLSYQEEKNPSVADRLQLLLAVTGLPRLPAVHPQRPTHYLGVWTLGAAVFPPVAQRLSICPQPVSRQEAQANPEQLPTVPPDLRPDQLCLCGRGDRSQISVVLPAVIQRLLPAVLLWHHGGMEAEEGLLHGTAGVVPPGLLCQPVLLVVVVWLTSVPEEGRDLASTGPPPPAMVVPLQTNPDVVIEVVVAQKRAQLALVIIGLDRRQVNVVSAAVGAGLVPVPVMSDEDILAVAWDRDEQQVEQQQVVPADAGHDWN